MANNRAEKEVFLWQGKNKAGHKVTGEILATSAALARITLVKQGIRSSKVKRKPKPLFGGSSKKIKPQDVAIFTRQLATMAKAGVPLVQAFDIVADGTDHEKMKRLIQTIRTDVSSGTSLTDSLGKHRDQFDSLFCSLVDAGETSGTLEIMLERIATYKEKTEALKAKVRKALTYPAAVVVVAIVVTGILLVKVVPQFAETFQSFGSELPAFTLFVLRISETMQESWLMVLLLLLASGYAFTYARKNSQAFSDSVDAALLKLPVLGNLVHDAVIARFSRTLSTTFAAGVPLVEALNSTAGAAGNAIYSKGIHRVREDVSGGMSLNIAMRSTGIFPNMLLQMTTIGEESGALDDMLGKVADHYEAAVDNAVDSLSSLIEPMIMSVLGVLVGGLMIAMYLPIFMLGTVI